MSLLAPSLSSIGYAYSNRLYTMCARIRFCVYGMFTSEDVDGSKC